MTDRLTLTTTDGEATAHARVHADLWEEALVDWLPVQLDAARRAHFRRVTAPERRRDAAVHRPRGRGDPTAAARTKPGVGDIPEGYHVIPSVQAQRALLSTTIANAWA